MLLRAVEQGKCDREMLVQLAKAIILRFEGARICGNGLFGKRECFDGGCFGLTKSEHWLLVGVTLFDDIASFHILL